MGVLTVEALMTREVESLYEADTVDLAEALMHLGYIRHLPVVTKSGALCGLVTHRDLLRTSAAVLKKTLLADRPEHARVRVAEIMTRDVTTVSPGTPALEAAELIRDRKFGCLPVVEGGRLVGILTEADFVSLAIRQLGDPGG